ncbi:histidine phosphatase family protein [Paracoccus sp. M683]|uniref:histidine phosphatase family protein n=1 Tax=Paracoccus sp. M683 TaxID=2594268 RepID=UPI001C8F50C2|nr:histidine phosphatase family protein [Paracoccus sp. M683]
MRVLLVRHGQSEWNAARRLQGQADIALSDLGRQQADALRPVIQAIGPCRAIASDLSRAAETANRLGASDARLTADLREIGVGDWTGLSIDEITARDQAAYLGWRAGTASPPGGESWPAFVGRVAGAIAAEQQTPCTNLLVVCHGGVIRALLHHFLALQPAHIIPVGPASLTALRLVEGKPARLELFNYRPDRLDFEAPD